MIKATIVLAATMAAFIAAQFPQRPVVPAGGGTGPTIATAPVLKGSGGAGVAAIEDDVTGLWASGSCSGTLRSDGTCVTGTSAFSTTDVLCAVTSDTPATGTCSGHGAQGADTQFSTTYTIPANSMVANRPYHIAAMLQLTSSATAPSMTLKIRSGTVDIYSTTAAASNGVTGNAYALNGYFIAGSAPGATVNTYSGTIASSFNGINRNFVVQPVSVATNASQTINITINYAAATAGNWMFLNSLYVEPVTGSAPPSIVQSFNDGRADGVTNLAFNMPAPSIPGNSLLCYVGLSGTGNTITNVSSRAAEQFTQLSHVATGQTQDIWWLASTAASGALVERISITLASAVGSSGIVCLELQNAATVNGTLATNLANSTALDSGTTTTTVANSLVLAGTTVAPFTVNPTANGSCGGSTNASWNTIATPKNSTTFGVQLRYAMVANTGNFCHSWTIGSATDWVGGVVALR